MSSGTASCVGVGTWTYSASFGTAGKTYTVTATQTDAAGNTGTSGAQTINFNTAPTVTSVSTTTATGSYKAGVTVAVTVTFDQPVTVTGTPTITLNTSPSRSASYASGSTTSMLTFNYVVQASDTSSRLDYSSTSALALSGGTIRNAFATNATLTLPATQGANDGLYAASIVIDTTAPTVAITQVNGSTVTFPFSTNAASVTSIGGTWGTPPATAARSM